MKKFFAAFVTAAMMLAMFVSVPVHAEDGIDMYRMYNPNSGEHFYTGSAEEKDNLISVGWTYEGIGWTAPTSGDPVYRLYNPNAGEHHYTLSRSEADYLVIAGWNLESECAWYSGGSVAIYRQYNPNQFSCNHNFTPSKDENDYLVSLGWKEEGIAWYGVGGGAPASSKAVGQLHVQNGTLRNQDNQTVQLKGVSSHGLAWYPEYVNEDAFRTLRDDWGVNVVRLANYTEEWGGYCSGGSQEQLKEKIDEGVKAATDLGMYVIIDWHILSDKNPMTHESEAEQFFDEMSSKYAQNDNVIYEICNEPQDSPWATVIKPYAEQIIPVIRKHSPNAVVLVGTNTWSQDVDEVIGNELSYGNVMYTLHFYAGTHKDALRNKLIKAADAGLPVFVSECSICDASGNGGIDYDSAGAWLELMNQRKISFVAWSLSNKNETSALIKSSCSKLSGWNTDDLSETGNWFRTAIKG
jgi:endoglucanase